MAKLAINTSVGSHTFIYALNNRLVVDEQLYHEHSEQWESDWKDWSPPWPLIASDVSRSEVVWLMRPAEHAALVRVAKGSRSRALCSISAHDIESIKPLYEILKERLPRSERLEGAKIAVDFWSRNPDGEANSLQRRVDVPLWSEINHNYTETVRYGLDKLIKMKPDSAGGKLILWHGVPGTGKTFAVRALARAWSSWVGLQYITDPEQFFSGTANYMLKVILGDSDDRDIYPGEPEEPTHDWRLLICEDTGELLSKDAKTQSGPGLTRLLNICDGLIGQGLQIMVLITTNEDIGTMHPAVTRSGRCISNIKFARLSAEEVKEWGDRNERPVPDHAMTLADLYADEDEPSKDGIGFHQMVGRR